MEGQNNFVQVPMQEPVQETKKKGSKLLIVLLCIIIILLVIVGLLLVFKPDYFSLSSGNGTTNDGNTPVVTDKEEEKEPVVTNYEVTDAKVSDLIKNLLKGSFSYGGCSALDKFTNDKKVEAADLSSLVIYHIVEMNEFYGKKDSFTLDEFNAAAKKYFDSSYKFDATSIDYKGQSCPQYNYDLNTNTFTKQQTACGGTCGPMTSYKLIKAVDTDGTLLLDTKVIFTKYDNGTEYDYFSDYEATNGIGTFNDDVNTLLDKGSNYRFTFKLVDGNYVFVSSEPVK